jgi:hypothetical protein
MLDRPPARQRTGHQRRARFEYSAQETAAAKAQANATGLRPMASGTAANGIDCPWLPNKAPAQVDHAAKRVNHGPSAKRA